MMLSKQKTFSTSDLKKYFKNQKSHLNTNSTWTDEFFSPSRQSLMSLDQNGNFIDPEGEQNIDQIDESVIVWKRANQIFGNDFKIFDNIELADIQQGILGNCYFLSVVAAMTNFPNLIEDIFKTKEPNPKGYYEIALFVDGEWNIVVVDDYFPFNTETNNLAFTQTNGNELWVILLEKAWAKVNGGYLNIIGGISTDPLNTLTSFPCSTVKYEDLSLDEFWQKIHTIESSNDIMCTETNDHDNLEAVGLISWHSYTIVSARQAVFKDKKIRLIKLRNPWGQQEWNGDWSDQSPLWNKETKKLFDHEDIDDGTFWISLEDFVIYFDCIHICYILYKANAKQFKIDEDAIKLPNVYNLYIQEQSRTSFGIYKNHWRFNRKLKNQNHPISIIVSKYEYDSKYISNVNGAFNSINPIEYTDILEPGHYLIWIYYNYDTADLPKLDEYIFRIISESQFTIQTNKYDLQFNLIRDIMISAMKYEYSREIEKNENFVICSNSFMETGLAYIFASNTSKNKLELDVNLMDITNFYNLPPNDLDEEVSIGINPGGCHIILGMKTQTYGEYGYNLEYSYASRARDGTGLKVFSDIDMYLVNISQIDQEFDYNFDILHESFISTKRETLRKTKTTIMTRQATKYGSIEDEKTHIMKQISKKCSQELIEKILKLPKSKFEEDYEWKHIDYGTYYYIGQVDKDDNKNGRGALFVPGISTTVCKWRDDKKSGPGLIYDGIYNKLIYDGNFENDKKNGFGKLIKPDDGNRYEGMFMDGKFSGKGIYYWENGTSWEGYFDENEFHGSGIFKDEYGVIIELFYDHGVKVDKSKIDKNYYSNSTRTIKLRKRINY